VIISVHIKLCILVIIKVDCNGIKFVSLLLFFKLMPLNHIYFHFILICYQALNLKKKAQLLYGDVKRGQGTVATHYFTLSSNPRAV
jgi:hypothetical protein